MTDDPVIGRGAVLLLCAVLFLALLGATHCSTAQAIKRRPVPTCLPSQDTEACKLTVGSTDRAGFVILVARRGISANAGISLGGMLFLTAWETPPMCEARPAPDRPGETPRVSVTTTVSSMELVLAEDARLPMRMRWYYTCSEGK